ncbi:Formylglycine-generating enzyme, required for sulfatase activity, contains SUMF1/FGE domain [Nitrosomonas sp. Nm51]|uniref:formylglycine-generating enzyme family protein n=1 Tax=Nitrosomonas sp. Nm51 TaxID=133720 RepID=UPI0008C19D21|nr:formylglycine-generating enzyme family protein [Nitrosomonas sp. Nm51]SEQ78919.1 Formylglycine-generating enzyme, required for sulfatase activity, contains SUMF1/FGE domain [Nitrosomonas sp. Nm51]
MAWGRLALIQAAGESEQVLQQTAALFGYEQLPLNDALQKDGDSKRVEDFVAEKKPEHSVPAAKIRRPPARFICVTQTEFPGDVEQPQRPGYLDDPEKQLALNDGKPGTYAFVPPRPLLPLARLLPFLLNSLGQPVMSNRLDHHRLARWITQGKPLQRLPYKKRQRWPQRLHIIVDCRDALEPFWSDFALIVSALKKLLGDEAVESVRLEHDRMDREDCLRITWLAGAVAKESAAHEIQWQRWQLPSPDTSILILGDLGASEPEGNAAIRWRRFARRLYLHAAPVVTLSPARQSPQDPVACRIFRPHALNDQRSLPRHPGRSGFDCGVQDGDQLQDCLTFLSALPVVDSGLLRRLRDELRWGGSELESLLWNHVAIDRIGIGIRLKEPVAKLYRERYQAQFAKTLQAEKFWRIVNVHHRSAFTGLRQLEKLNQCLFEDQQDDGMFEYMQSLCATLAKPDADAARRKMLQQQCRTVLASAPPGIWQDPNRNYRELGYQLFASAYEDDIRAGKWPQYLEPGFDPAQLRWLFDDDQHEQRVTWLVAQTGDQGQCVLLQQDKADAAGQTVVAPVAAIQAQAQIPPVLTLPSGERIPVQHGTHVRVPHDKALALHTFWERVHLEAMQKPAWAHAIYWDSKLYASMTLAAATHYFSWDAFQREREGISLYGWINQDPQDIVQFDDCGLYFDLTISGVTQRFRWIEPGTFQMGSPETELERFDDEAQHQVTVSKGFWLADTTCTQALWQAVMRENPAHFKESDDNPVEQVSWDDVQHFIKTVNKQHPAVQLRLPTEAEWEYACRAGNEAPFSFGQTMTAGQVNFDGNFPYAGGQKGDYRGKTVAVKSLPANPWGLYEMHGNVYEWCQDWYGDYPAEPVTNPQGPAGGAGRVIRGGSWLNLGGRVRSASRNWRSPDERNDDLGFRLALGHVEPGQAGHDGQPLRDDAAGNHDANQQGMLKRLKQKLRKKQ